MEKDKQVHSEELKVRIKTIPTNFKALDIDNILDIFLYDPNTDEVFGFTLDNIEDLSEYL